jgi:hydroxymethylpyrimidine pyrophosphatase-like HAD family hydrolase
MDKETNLETIVCDIDGTISDRRHRLKHLEGKKDWGGFFKDMHKDPPIKEVTKQIEKYAEQRKNIVFVTGRPEEYRKTTEKWINEHLNLASFTLIMRETKNYESDLSLKKRILKDSLLNLIILKVYDDREELIQMWREAGLECIDCSGATGGTPIAFLSH